MHTGTRAKRACREVLEADVTSLFWHLMCASPSSRAFTTVITGHVSLRIALEFALCLYKITKGQRGCI